MARIIRWDELKALYKELTPNEYGRLMFSKNCEKFGKKIIYMRDDMKKINQKIEKLNEEFDIKESEINNERDNEIKKLQEKKFDQEKLQEELEEISKNIEKKFEKAGKKLEKFKMKRQELNSKLDVKKSSLKSLLTLRYPEDPKDYEKRTGKKYVMPTLEQLKGIFGENKK